MALKAEDLEPMFGLRSRMPLESIGTHLLVKLKQLKKKNDMFINTRMALKKARLRRILRNKKKEITPTPFILLPVLKTTDGDKYFLCCAMACRFKSLRAAKIAFNRRVGCCIVVKDLMPLDLLGNFSKETLKNCQKILLFKDDEIFS